MSLHFTGFPRWLLRPKFLTIIFGFAASLYLIMSYTPNTAPDLEPLTFAYKIVHGVPIYLDVYLPYHDKGLFKANGMNPNGNGDLAIVPVLLYFHGGGLTVGNRKSWFPQWLQS
jgi:acetyl esterase/lipase